ncbi:MAG TPA: glycine cleavage system protein GcvH [Candidatus Hydrogenedentes bacterium]|nr:glycine cleavage system protein GcvH [Candidatus Hydrogenedentota bacterium]
MNPSELRYTEDHEWIGREGDVYVVGITDFAQDQLGDITFIELPAVGRAVKKHEETAAVESVKAAGDVYAPVAGTVTAVNEALEREPELVNQDPFGKGWFFKLGDVDAAQLEELMDAAAYTKFLETCGD